MKAVRVLSVIGICLAVLAAAAGGLSWFSAALTRTPAFTGPDGEAVPESIAEVRWMELNGARQFVLLRGMDRTHPVLLLIHGGPGMDEIPWFRRHNAALEHDFVVAYWAQRGSGKSYDPLADASLVTPQTIYEDARHVAELLSREFGGRKIVVAGHSWGARVGLELAAARPDLVAAYVGIGQLTGMVRNEQASWAWTLKQAEQAKDVIAVNDLRSMLDYPAKGELGREAFPLKNAYLAKYGGSLYRKTDLTPYYQSFTGPEYSWFDLPRWLIGMGSSLLWAWDPLLAEPDPIEALPSVAVPVYLVSGRYDQECPIELAREYYEVLKAPRKRFVTFENSAHAPPFEEPERFNRFMVETVLAENRDALD